MRLEKWMLNRNVREDHEGNFVYADTLQSD